eukprot:16448236-Heterocapsa_arctica.AAC.1
MHQSVGDGSRHLLQWLDPSAQVNQACERSGQEHQQTPPAVTQLGPCGSTVIANEIRGPPDGMVSPDMEIMLLHPQNPRMGDSPPSRESSGRVRRLPHLSHHPTVHTRALAGKESCGDPPQSPA